MGMKPLKRGMGSGAKVDDTQVSATGADIPGMHDICLGVLFFAMILSPCLVALRVTKDIDDEE
jgi:hypothetical protein